MHPGLDIAEKGGTERLKLLARVHLQLEVIVTNVHPVLDLALFIKHLVQSVGGAPKVTHDR